MKIFGNVFSMKKLDLNGQKWEKSKIEKKESNGQNYREEYQTNEKTKLVKSNTVKKREKKKRNDDRTYVP